MIEGRKIDNFTMRIYLETIQSIVGPNGLKSILNYDHLEQYIDNIPPDNDKVEVPETKRMRLALEKFVEGFEERFSEVDEPTVELREEDDGFYIIDRDCYISEGVQSEEPVCGVYIGITQSLIKWITGHDHEVKEIECRATGYSADVFRIAKTRESQKI